MNGKHFPRWLRRIDPTLAGEDTNTLYGAFLARRRDHRRVWRLDVLYDVPKFITWALGVVFFFMLFFGESVLGLKPSRSVFHYAVVYVTWIFSFLILLVQFFLRGKRRNYMVLPVRLSGVFRTLDFLEQQALDLWLAGARGKDIAEGLYLEMWERAFQIFRIIAPVILFFVFLYLANDFQNRGLADLYFYPLALILVGELVVASLIVISFFCYTVVDFRHDCWLKFINYRKFMLRNIIGGLFGLILILGFAFLMLHFRGIRSGLIAFFNTDEIADLTVKLLLINTGLFIVMVFARRLIQRRLRDRFAHMDKLFLLLMSRAAMHDPDYRRHPELEGFPVP